MKSGQKKVSEDISPDKRFSFFFTRLDRDSNGRISPEEMKGRGYGKSLGRADEDGDGSLSKAEFLKAMQAAGERYKKRTGKHNPPQ